MIMNFDLNILAWYNQRQNGLVRVDTKIPKDMCLEY